MISLITGASGFIGGRLIQPGDRGLIHSKLTKLSNAVNGDLLDSSSLDLACKGIGTIFHCAGYAHGFSSSSANLNYKINFEGTRNLICAAGKAGVKRFVFLSSVKAMAEPGEDCVDEDWPGEPQTPYGRAKRAAEDVVLEVGAKYGMHVVNLRLAMVYGFSGQGNLNRMASAIRSGWFPPLPQTDNRRSLVHVQDVVELMRLAAKRPEASGRTYIVADSRAYSGYEIYGTIREVLGITSDPFFRVPVSWMRAAGRMNGRIEGVINRLINSECYSSLRIEQELGWRTRISLKEGLREMLSISGSDL